MRKALGRGLDALLPSHPPASLISTMASPQPLRVALSKIRPNHLQPRRHFDPQSLSELAASIKVHGLAQPILVSPDSDGTYELIAGERRLRASELAGLTEIDVVVRQPTDDKQRLALALIENLQREDLNSIETALGYLRLMKEFGINQTDVGDLVGKSKQAISNTLGLLDLPDEIQKAIQLGQLQEGHGRTLLRVKDPIERHKLFQLAVTQSLSVRDMEDMANELNGVTAEREPQRRRADKAKDANQEELESLLRQRLGTKVAIRTGKDAHKGTLVIHFYNLEDFDRIVGIINK